MTAGSERSKKIPHVPNEWAREGKLTGALLEAFTGYAAKA
jgi:hypothetical protein